MNRIQHTVYLHNSNEELSDLWEHDAPQQDEYHYCCYEVRLEGQLDLDTGKFYLQAVQGVPLEHEVEV